jgi:hypothetical protein
VRLGILVEEENHRLQGEGTCEGGKLCYFPDIDYRRFSKTLTLRIHILAVSRLCYESPHLVEKHYWLRYYGSDSS